MARRTAVLTEAFAKLEITSEAVDDAPRIEHLLRVVGGRQKVMDYLSSSEEPEVRTIFDLRKRLTVVEQNAVPLEAYAVAAKISPKKLFGFIMQEVMEQSTKISAMLAKIHHPEMVQTSITQGKKAAGIRDREMLHRAVGFLPTPKNSVTVVNGDQHINRNKTNVAVLPPFENVARDLTQRFIDVAPQKSLPAKPERKGARSLNEASEPQE